MAIIGGFVLTALVAIVVLSILGRELNAILHNDLFQNHAKGFADWALGIQLPGIWGPIKLGPFNGDYELVEAGIAFSIFSFLPLAQITGAHASVDIFTSWLPERADRVLTTVIEIVFAIVLVIIALQLWEGTQDKFNRGQTTFLLQVPIWWGYAASLLGAVMAAVVAIYLALARIAELLLGRRIAPVGEGAEH
ncbi:TRAP transporter small permease [Sinisalibacter lacisalsi]|nr:TRAP transporter small permease [Sinisalibacter lacisalsi]